MTQENRPQETPALVPEPGELTATELAQVVGGTDGPPSTSS
jgi:bacteriocin-like protein